MPIEPFCIQVPDGDLVDLNQRLDATRWTPPVAGAGWTLGMDADFLFELVQYWRTQFNWRTVESRLNRVRHFMSVDHSERLHFVHMRSSIPDALPIVLTHGWPGTFAELLSLGAMLSEPTQHGADPRDAFHVVIPSLPGFAFSSAPQGLGCGVFDIAKRWVRLMETLGYPRFVAQGGDLGAGVSTALGLRHSGNTMGIHLNFIPGSYRPYLAEGSSLTSEERQFLDRRSMWLESEGGYAHVQSTKPDTLGPALNDSPVGLAAWMTEKFRNWSDCDGVPDKRFSKDELLTMVMLYWVSRSMPTAIRLYAEVRNNPLSLSAGERVAVPVAIAEFPREIPMPPQSYVERGFNVVQWNRMEHGGHFAAMEEPAALARDIRSFARNLRSH